MQPSSLIFVVIVGIWAAFFVQYWVRRREHIATARSVDAFTATMRVLAVRDRQPSVEPSERPRSYAVSPVRPSRPQVTVKRADAMLTVRDVMARGRSAHVAAEPSSTRHGSAHPHGASIHRARSDAHAEGGRSFPVISAIGRAPRPIRGLTLLLGLLGVLVYGVLSAAGVLVPWAFLAPLALATAGFLWVRADVRASAERRTSDSRGLHSRSDFVGSTQPALADDFDAEGSGAAGPAEAIVDRRDVVFDLADSGPAPVVEAGAASARPVRAPLLDDDDIPLTWDPVPVPRPTYTMKAKATRVAAVPVAEVPVAVEASSSRASGTSFSGPRSSARPRAADLADVVDDSWDDDVPRAFPTRRVVGA